MCMHKKTGPIFIKETSDAELYVANLEELNKYANGSIIKEEINEELYKAKLGIIGENEVAYQLKNSGIDMLILHDIYLECNDLSAQIDYIVITRKKTYLLECKHICGNIKITDKGDFIITTNKNEKKAMSSPITQNERHMNVVKELRLSNRPNFIPENTYRKSIDNNYRSLVIFTNSENIIDDKNAKDEIRNQVIRADQLISKIKEINETEKEYTRTDDEMTKIAMFYLNNNITENNSTSKRFKNLMNKFREQRIAELENKINFSITTKCPECGGKLLLKTATKGDNIGNHFLGCSNYPKCKYILNI